MYKKRDARAELLFCLVKLLLFWRSHCRRRRGILRWCYKGRFATTIFSATQRCNVGTMLQPFETMSQQCCSAVLRWKSSLQIFSCNITFKVPKIGEGIPSPTFFLRGGGGCTHRLVSFYCYTLIAFYPVCKRRPISCCHLSPPKN